MSSLPDHFSRYKKFIGFMLKYWNSDLMNQTAAQAMDESNEEETSEEFKHSPEELVEDLKKMGPTYIKLGQLLSTRPDLLPQPYLDALASLQDDVAPIPYEKVHEIVEEEIGTRISKAFESFEEEPLASASIGQVHLATLRSGVPVAVKIQRPGIKKQFLEDLDTLTEITKLAVKHTETAQKYAFDEILAELKHILLQELDYVREAENLRTLKQNLTKFQHLKVPKPIDDYSSAKVLTMERIEGKKITSISPFKQIEVDYAPLVEELVEAYLQQIINDGFVHADPHPGNIHLTHDNQIALIDLGMVAKFTPRMREFILELLIGISKNDGDKTGNIVLKMSKVDDDAQIALFKKTISTILLDSRNSKAKDLQTGRILIQMNRIATENGIHLPVEINILGKIMMNMDQIIAFLDPEFNLRDAIKRNVSKMMRNKVLEELKPENFLSVVLELKKLAENLPERLNKITHRFAENELEVKVNALDEDKLTKGFQKVANRITLGLILASMIIGASMLMQVPSDFSIFGYPGLAIVFFLLAAAGGLALSWVIIFRDK